MLERVSIASQIPDSFAAGTTVDVTLSYASYPASGGWTAMLHLAGAALASVTGTATGKAFRFKLTAANSAPLPAGNYQWRVVVTDGTDKFIADSGVLLVQPNIETATAGSMQSFEERDLAVVEAILNGRMTTGMESYVIGNRQATLIPHKELRAYRAELKRAIYAQRNPGKFGPQVRVAFTGVRSES